METKTATRGREKPTEVSLLRVLKSAVHLELLYAKILQENLNHFWYIHYPYEVLEGNLILDQRREQNSY